MGYTFCICKMKFDLLNLIKGKDAKKFTEKNVSLFLIQIIYALLDWKINYGIQHRDINKLGNILAYKDNWYLIFHFGSSRFPIDN